MSMQGDFFSDKLIKGQVCDKFSDATHPSSRDWAGNLTHISVKNILDLNGSASVAVFFNDYDGPPTPPHNLSLTWDNNHPRINWIPKRETNFSYYNIYKKRGNNPYQLFTTTTNHNFTDVTETRYNPGNDKIYVYYKITAVYTPSTETDYSNEVRAAVNDNSQGLNKLGLIKDQVGTMPKDYVLKQNYPNPFNPTTTIKYGIPEQGYVKLTVYNILGKEISTLVDEYQEAGFYSILFSNFNLPTGVYFYVLNVNNFKETKKFSLLK